MVETVWLCETRRDLYDFAKYSVEGGDIAGNLQSAFPFLRRAGLRPLFHDEENPAQHAILGFKEEGIDIAVYGYHTPGWGEVTTVSTEHTSSLLNGYLLRYLKIPGSAATVQPVGGLVIVVNSSVGKGRSACEVYKRIIQAHTPPPLQVKICCANELRKTPMDAVDPHIPDYKDDDPLICPF
ncbi:MAG TPA: hypothetical protein VJJ82_03920 [Candidatus Nanoarchaeia archaeon]|nr:hypothetical protein [Candidatus Nanoarchaeia archaeon]